MPTIQQMTQIALNLIVALPSEAKPINRHLGLLRDNRCNQYPLYRNGHISLVVSGCGAQNAAAATARLHQIHAHRHADIWINLGIAGHPKHALGDTFLANAIDDVATGVSWILETGNVSDMPSGRIFTVADPDTSYALGGMVDMEAAGFYRSAMECTTPDKIYCLKIISDNSDNPAVNINGKMVSRLIGDHLDKLDRLIAQATAGA